jgi:pyridoxine 4-dehydrogenase
MDGHETVTCSRVSRLGLGTGRLASLGSGNTLRTARAIVEAAFDEGITLIDTADTYGSSDCESWLGQVLQPFTNAFRISTKAGCRFAEFPGPLRLFNQIGKKALKMAGARPRFDSPYLTRCIEGSLRRLRRERLDLFFLHDPPIAVLLNAEWEPAITAAKHAGKIDTFGVSSPSADVLRLAAASGLCEILQLPLAAARVVSAAATQPLMINHVFGRLADHPTVQSIGGQLGLDGRSMLLAYAGGLRGVSCVLTGTRCPVHLRENARAVENPLPPWARARLDQLFC